MTFDLKNAPIDPKIDSAPLQPLPYLGTKYEPPSLFYGRDMRETDTHRQTHTDTHKDATDHSIVDHFVGATIIMCFHDL